MARVAGNNARRWQGFLLAGLLATGGYFALPTAEAQNLAYDAIGLAAVVAILVGIRLHRPARPRPWLLLALGNGIAVGGDLIWTYNENVRGLVAPFPSTSDLLYFLGYGILLAGVLLLAHEETRDGDRAAALDTAIVTIGGGVLIWSFLIRPAIQGADEALAARLVAGGYPALDVLILATAVRLTLGLTRRTVAVRLLIAALTLNFVGDIVYAILLAQGRYYTGHPINAVWLLSYVLYGVLALHPSMRERPGVATEGGLDIQTDRLSLLALAAIAGPVLLIAQTWWGLPLDLPIIIGVSALLPLLALARLHLRDARFRALMRHAAEGTAIVDRDGKTRYQGPAAARILRVAPATLVGGDIFGRVHPDDQARARRLFAALADERGRTSAATLRIRRADGVLRNVEVHATNLLHEPSIGGIVVNYRDVTERTNAEALLAGQAALLERIAEDAPLAETLTTLACQVEAIGDGARVAINLLEDDGVTLRCVAAPSLPAGWLAATEIVRAEEGVGACGTAAARAEPVVTADIAVDPAWADYCALALEHGLRACWSLPILTRAADARATKRRVLGTFAVYYGVPRQPGEAEWAALARSVGLAALAIERARAADALRQGADSFASLFDATGDALFIHAGGTIVAANRAYAEMLGRELPEVIGSYGLDYLAPATRLRAEGRMRAGTEGAYEGEVVRRDGRVLPVEFVVRTIRYRGHPARLVVQRDIGERLRARATLEASEARFRALVQHASDMVTVIDPTGRITYQSPTAHVLGTDPAETVGRCVFALIHRDDRRRARALFDRLLGEPSAVLTATLRARHRDGSWRTVEVTATNLLAESAVGGIVTNLRDITAREEATAALRRSEAILAAAQRIGHIGSWEFDIVRGTLNWSDEVFRIAGFAPQAFVPTLERFSALLHPDDRAMVEAARRDSTERGISYAHDCRLIRPGGEVRVVHQRAETICDATGRPVRRLGVIQDVTEQRALEAQLQHQATHDALTGLPNRALFLDRLAQALGQARRGRAAGAVLFLDLDRFKEVNDSRGHDAGDRFLIAVAKRLHQGLRDEDTLARLGGDEFAVLLAGVADAAEAARTATRLLANLARPLVLDGQEHTVTASVGIVLAEPDYARPEEVLRDADVAMYRAKDGGRAGFALFDPAMQAALANRLTLERDLRLAIERDELLLYYHPVVDLRSGLVAMVEALVRWQHPTRGLVSPCDFIPLAEETGLIRELGRWVLAAACRQAAAWWRDGHRLPVAVNLSAREFQQPGLAEEVAATLRAAALDPRALQLEITESLAMRDAGATAVTLAALRALGVRVAIDDFGTGYSSLAYLKRLPVDTLKIDKAFIDGLENDPDAAAIATAIVRLGQTLGLKIVAEGVETAGQATDLRLLGCDFAQGYYFARPLPAEEIAPLLGRGARRPRVATGELPLRSVVASETRRSRDL